MGWPRWLRLPASSEACGVVDSEGWLNPRKDAIIGLPSPTKLARLALTSASTKLSLTSTNSLSKHEQKFQIVLSVYDTTKTEPRLRGKNDIRFHYTVLGNILVDHHTLFEAQKKKYSLNVEQRNANVATVEQTNVNSEILDPVHHASWYRRRELCIRPSKNLLHDCASDWTGKFSRLSPPYKPPRPGLTHDEWCASWQLKRVGAKGVKGGPGWGHD